MFPESDCVGEWGRFAEASVEVPAVLEVNTNVGESVPQVDVRAQGMACDEQGKVPVHHCGV